MDPNTKQMAKFIVDGAARMPTLIDDLLSFASTGVQEPPQRVDLQHAVAQATQNLVQAIKVGGAMVTVDRLPVVRGNEIHLVRLFQILINNAVKYRSEEPVEIRVTAEQRGPDWALRIKNNGLGIAPEDQVRVFMPFIRLANRDVPGGGAGISDATRRSVRYPKLGRGALTVISQHRIIAADNP
jgi:light-regulated signal transduction histidine kinase (bacteriophytochrome)